ncbi:metallopeptidase TldD-related protein [Sphingomonas sp.]|uniref:TldD/PmbA family protein n=1 Tax=Sphingomonas sp. TaxID=28214 RepID=UPI00286D7E76|nr:metallopeptidase TldD-related protein [Sphingomonas sp.]
MLSIENATAIAHKLVERAVAAGASAADVLYAGERSSSVEVRMGGLEQVNRSEGEHIGLRFFNGSRFATVASSNFTDEALDLLVERAAAMAAEAPEDPYAGLAPPELLERGKLPDIDAFDPAEPDPAALQARAVAAESAALAVPGVANSNGGSAGASASTMALATSTGFARGYSVSGHSCSASVIAGEGETMQRDHAWHSARHLEDLEDAAMIGRRAGERTVARLNPGRIKAGPLPVLFDPRLSHTLLGHFIGAISGAVVARKSSFLKDRLGERVFAPGITITDDPLRPRGLRSRAFDGEGLPVTRRDLVADGILTTWLADCAAARQLGIAPTGHAVRSGGVGPGNLYLAPGQRSRADLLAAYPLAILVTELIGQGVNSVTGDYSRGAAGFIVRGGEIAEPIAEITIASNLIDMFATLEPGSDLEFRNGVDAPTILVPQMTVAAA